MMPIAPLKAAIRAVLVADAQVLALLGGPKVFDDVPRTAQPPYIAFGDATARENGTATDRGHITELTLFVWSKQGGSKEALALADRLSTVLDDTALTVQGHRLVLMRVAAIDVRRTADKDLTRVALRLRIVTEVL